jgi:hypothetical protein
MPDSASRPRTLAWLLGHTTWPEDFPTTELQAAIGNKPVAEVAPLGIPELTDLIKSTNTFTDPSKFIGWARTIHSAVSEAGLRTQATATPPNATAATPQVFRLEAPKPLGEMGLRELLEAWSSGSLVPSEAIRYIRALPDTPRVERRTPKWVVVDPSNPERPNIKLTLDYYDLLLDPASRVRYNDRYQSGDTLHWLRTLERALGTERLAYVYPFGEGGVTKLVGPDEFGNDWASLSDERHCAMVQARQNGSPWLKQAIGTDRLRELTRAVFGGIGAFAEEVAEECEAYRNAITQGGGVAASRYWSDAMEVRAPF